MKIKCPICNTIQEIPETYNRKTIKCLKCKADITAVPYKPPSPQPSPLPPRVISERKVIVDADPPLPGTTVAAIWEIIGLLSLGICIAVGIVTIALVKKSETGESVISLVIWIGIGAAWSIIPFSVAAIIKAINANTKELRKIRYAVAKFFSEKMK